MEWVNSLLVKKLLKQTSTISTATNNECYQKDAGQKVSLFLIKTGSQMLEVLNRFQLRQPRDNENGLQNLKEDCIPCKNETRFFF